MILLDTNVISAVIRDSADKIVKIWLDLQPPGSIWITSITVFEIELGLRAMPDGRRRNTMMAAFNLMLQTAFAGRIAPFDQDAALLAGRLAARRRQIGRPVGMRDTQIAGIALARRATIATRNTTDFHGLDTPLINPWQ